VFNQVIGFILLLLSLYDLPHYLQIILLSSLFNKFKHLKESF